MKQITVFYALQLGIAAMFLGGCTDNPQDAAVKKLQQDTASAIEQLGRDGDLAAANERMRSILTGTRTLGSAADASLLTAANAFAAKAQSQRASLPLSKAELNQQFEWLSQNFKLLADLDSQLQRTDTLLTLSDGDAAALEKWIGTDDNPETLKGKIAAAQAEQQLLKTRKAPLEKTFTENQSEMLEITAKADDLLRQAQRLEGQQRLEMENEAFELLKTKNAFSFNAQAAESELAGIDSQLAIVEPHLQRLQGNLEAVQAKLSTLNAAQLRETLNEQKRQIVADMETQKTALINRIGTIKSQFASHLGIMDEILALTDEAIDHYGKVRSRDLDYILSMVTGQTNMLAGALTAEKVQYALDVATQIDGIFQAYQAVRPTELVNPAGSEPDPNTVQKAYVYFDQAVEAYNNALGAAGRLHGTAKNAEVAAVQGQVLALRNKMRLSDRINDFQTGEKTQAELDALLEKANQMGEVFSQSATAIILKNGLDYVPSLPINSAMIIESIRSDFANWRQLPLPEMEKEINRLIPRIQTLKSEYASDEQITLFLDQELQTMEEQKAKGFTEEQTPTEDANNVQQGNMPFPQP